MKGKQILFLLSFFLSLCFVAQAESLRLAKPQSTELVYKNAKTQGKATVSLFRYNSKLSKETIMNFYQLLFTKQKLKQEKPKADLEGEMIFFTKNNITRAQLFFLSPYQGKINYGLLIYDFDAAVVKQSSRDKNSGKSKCPNCKE